MLARFLSHHVLANLTFVLVLIMGTAAYLMMPREKDPTINFNWIQITTPFPGASAEDVESLVTDPIEEAVAKLSDVRFNSSVSREGISSVLVRFEEIDERTYDKRLNDLRREVQNAENTELPEEAESPFIYEITSSNAYPTATLVLSGQADDETLRDAARTVEKELERLSGIERVDALGLRDPELKVWFDPELLTGAGINPTHLSDTVALYFRDIAAGNLRLGDEQWLLRLKGTDPDPEWLAGLPVVGAQGELPLEALAQVRRGREEADELISFRDGPAVMLSVFKQGASNTLELLERLHGFIATHNPRLAERGLELVLVDDQTTSTRKAISVMQTNALVGLALVLFVAWVFLGTRIALLTAIGIPFTLAGTFWLLWGIDQTLNNSVLLGVVISLGMLVDDAVVVVEGIYYRLQRGIDVVKASVDSLREVFTPVTASVATTMAAFLPLMLMPGILGQFMMVIPLTVSVALAISLLEAYWMLPAHVIGLRVNYARKSRVQRWRERFTHALRVKYARSLIAVLRRPRRSLLAVVLLFAGSLYALAAGWVHVNFFAMETLRLFYVSVEMPAGVTLQETLARTAEVERRVRTHLEPGDARGVVSYSGIKFTETEPLLGDQYGQVLVSLNAKTPELRTVEELIADMRRDVESVAGPLNVSFLKLSEGPPVTKPISVKVRGDDFTTIRAAVRDLKAVMGEIPAVFDITDNDGAGRPELELRVDTDAVQRAGLDPATVSRILRLMADGEIAADFQSRGEKVEVRVQAEPKAMEDIRELLRLPVALPGGGEIALGDLVHAEVRRGQSNIRHYNLRRAITLEADLNKDQLDTITANRLIQEAWNDRLQLKYPSVDLDFSGELDDIQESLDSIFVLFLFGIGVIYLILGTQFRSYWQPFMILSTVPMAFIGVVLGLLISGNPLSLYTMYGVVALAGIAVNAAIVLISAANQRLEAGMSVLHATLYAARRRVIPILITSLTTIAGLFSLATGLGGRSLLWGPVATAIVWGLAFSTLLTLFVVPLLYRFFMRSRAVPAPAAAAGPPASADTPQTVPHA